MVTKELLTDGAVDLGAAAVGEIDRHFDQVFDAEPCCPQAGCEVAPGQSTLLTKVGGNVPVGRLRDLTADNSSSEAPVTPTAWE